MTVKNESDVAQSCATLSDPTDCSPPGSSVHEIFQARVLELGAIAFSDFPSIRVFSSELSLQNQVAKVLELQLQFNSVTQLCPTLCDPMNCSMPGLPVGEGNGTPLQYSYLENPMGGGAWYAAVHGVANSWT